MASGPVGYRGRRIVSNQGGVLAPRHGRRERDRDDRPSHRSALSTPIVRLHALLGSGGLSPKGACLANRRQAQARDAFDLCILWLGGHARHGCAGSLATAQRDQAMETLLGFTCADYAGQVLEYLEPAERERFAGEARWAEIVERSFALLEAAPPQSKPGATP